MPPTLIRPMAPPATATAPNTPKARLRSSPSAKLVVINDGAVGAAMNGADPLEGAGGQQPDEVARPPRKEARVNTRMPAMKVRRRPRISPARPPSSRRPPKVRV